MLDRWEGSGKPSVAVWQESTRRIQKMVIAPTDGMGRMEFWLQNLEEADKIV
jgi:hypothetical protein